MSETGYVRRYCSNCQTKVKAHPLQFKDGVKCPKCNKKGLFLRRPKAQIEKVVKTPLAPAPKEKSEKPVKPIDGS